MKNIEKSLVNFLSGKEQRVSDETLCDCAKKDINAADEIIDILFNVINNEIEKVRGTESLDKIRELLKSINTIINNSDNVNRKIVARRSLKLIEKIERIEIENKNKFVSIAKAIEELEKTKEIVYKLNSETLETETKQYDFMDYLIDTIKELPYIEFTLKKVPSLVNVKDKKEITLFQNIMIKYINSIKDNNEEDMLYYNNLLSLIASQNSFNIKEKDRKKCLEILHTEINRLSINKKLLKKNSESIEKLKKLVDIIQGNDDKEQIIDVIASKYKIEVFFDEKLLSQAKVLRESKIGKMTDREIVNDYVITIDKENALEIDDALSCEKLSNGNYLLGVHIASILGYVPYESEIVQNAINRNRSIYLPKKYQTTENDFDRVIPIFPYDFSAKAASLLENEARLTRSYYFEIDKYGNIVKEEFKKTITTNNKKTTYDEVDEILRNGSNNKKLETTVKNLEEVIRRINNNYKGTEIYEQVKENIDDFSDLNVKQTGSQKMVYQAMLLTGNRVAEFFSKNNYPCLYRVHEVNEENIRKLELMVNNLNKTYGGSQYKKLFELISGLYPNGRYDIKGSHYGLNLEHYCHCTSALRRASDIIVEHALEVCYDKTPTKEELEQLKLEIEKRKYEINNKQEPISWFIKEYKREYQKRKN